jgi:hypothetical protein
MMNLAAKANASISGSYGKFGTSVSWADKATMVDSLYCSGESCN